MIVLPSGSPIYMRVQGYVSKCRCRSGSNLASVFQSHIRWRDETGMILFKGIQCPKGLIGHAVFVYVRYHAHVKRGQIESHGRHRFDPVFGSGRASGLGSTAEAVA